MNFIYRFILRYIYLSPRYFKVSDDEHYRSTSKLNSELKVIKIYKIFQFYYILNNVTFEQVFINMVSPHNFPCNDSQNQSKSTHAYITNNINNKIAVA